MPIAIASVTSVPAKMLDLYPQKGSLQADVDADLCVLSEVDVVADDGTSTQQLEVDQVWKFGKRVYERV